MLPAGGMAEVYRARNPRLDTLVAIKILRADADADMAKRFEEEARTLARLTHPHIVRVFDAGVCEDRPYMVMEFLEGCDLSRVIADRRLPDLVQQLKIALQIARALEYVNSHGVLHRDIKPGNIIVSESGDARIIDFGIAKSSASPKTQVGFALGTLRYMAPEQMNGQVSAVLDVYAFGAVLYELITGTHAVTGATLGEVTTNVLTKPPDPAPLADRGTPESVVRLIQQCMAKAPEERPAGFSPVCAELERAISGLTFAQPVAAPAPAPLATPPAVPESGRSKKLALYLGIPVVAAAVIATVLLATHKPADPQSGGGKAGSGSVRPLLPPVLPGPRGEMVLVSAGNAVIGPGDKPVHVPDYYIDKTEVTLAAWADYCRTAGCSVPTGDPKLPVGEVTYNQAEQFCQAAGKRLPSANEWEKAARGAEAFHYPWGNVEDAHRANYSGRIAPVATYTSSASPFGAVDMAGNVWEWVDRNGVPSAADLGVFHSLQPPPTKDEPWKAVYGGSHSTKLAPVWDFALAPARLTDPTIGFRCAKSAPE
jgi:serine/threonine-protein kinase